MNDRLKTAQRKVVNESGIEIQQLYTAQDVQDSGGDAMLGQPGAYPFTRGIHAEMYRKQPWTMRQYTGFGNAADTNQRFKYLIANGQTGFAPVKSRLGDARRSLDRLDAVFNELFVVEMHPIGCVVFDAIPQRLEFRTIQHRAANWNGVTSLVGVLDFQAPTELAQNRGDRLALRFKGLRENHFALLDRCAKYVLDLAAR